MLVLGAEVRHQRRAQNGLLERRSERSARDASFISVSMSPLIRAIPWEVPKSPPLSFKSPTTHAQDIHFIDDGGLDDPQLALRWPARSSRARPGRVLLIFDREARSTSARLQCRPSFSFLLHII